MSTVKLELNANELAIVCNALRRAKKYVGEVVGENKVMVSDLKVRCINLRANIEFLKDHEHEDHNNEDSTRRRELIEEFEKSDESNRELMIAKERLVSEDTKRHHVTEVVLFRATELMNYFDEEERFF